MLAGRAPVAVEADDLVEPVRVPREPRFRTISRAGRTRPKEVLMSVIMTLVAGGDPDELERRAAANPDGMRAIADRAKEFGLIAHRFYGAEGKIMVVDEWPDPESFQRFWEAMKDDIEPLMREVGVKGEPDVTFWRRLETHDEVGWD
jgi:hypothetical protein